jgi:uncharacterized membrane protein
MIAAVLAAAIVLACMVPAARNADRADRQKNLTQGIADS